MIPPKCFQNVLQTLIASSFLISSLSYADSTILEVKDWALMETTSDNNEICYLKTSNKGVFRAEDYYLEIHKLKNKVASPVEVFMRINKNKKASTGLLAQVSLAGSSISFSDLTGEKSRFWGLPKNLSLLLDQLKADKEDHQVKAKGGKKEIDFTFTGRGFAEVLSEMEKRCNSGAGLVNKSFETELLGQVANNVEPTALNTEKTTQLRTLYFNAYTVNAQLSEVKAGLNQVLAKYQPMVDELKSNRETLNQILNRDLPQSQKTLLDAQKQQADAKVVIAQIDSALPGLIAKVQSSQKAYDEVRAILSPLEPEFNRLVGQLRNAQQDLSDAQSRLSSIDNRIQSIAQQISSLNSEGDNIERILPQLRNDLDRAISILRNAEAQRSAFNISFERERRLRNNGEYNHMLTELSANQNQLSQVQTQISQIRAERDRVVNDLNRCKAGGANELTPQAPDCSQLEQALQNANSQLSERESTARNLSSRNDDLRNRISQVERQVEQDVRREYETLVNREDQARREQNRIQDDYNRQQNRLSQIRSSEIPSLERERSNLSSERPSVTSRISQANSNIDRSNRELSSFKAANDWDRKARAVDNKARQLQQDQLNLSSAQNQKSAAQLRLQQGSVTETEMKNLILRLNAQVISLNQRAAQLEESIKTLPAERAPFDTKIASLQADLTSKKNDLLNILR